MKKTVVIIISLVLCAGLFCFLFFGGNNKDDKGGEIKETIENTVSKQRKSAGENVNDERNSLNENRLSNNFSHESQDDNTDSKNKKESLIDNNVPNNETSSLNHSSENKNEADVDSQKVNENVYPQKTEIIKIEQNLPENAKDYNADLKSLASVVLDSFQIDENGFSFKHPFVPDGLHLGVKLQIFKHTSLGDETIIRYVSDSGWLNDEDYDAKEHNVNASFKDYYIGSESDWEQPALSVATIALEIKSCDLESGVVQIYDAYIKNGEVMLLTAENKEGF